MSAVRLLLLLKLGLVIQLGQPRGGQFQVGEIVRGGGLELGSYRHQRLSPRSLCIRSFSITGDRLP